MHGRVSIRFVKALLVCCLSNEHNARQVVRLVTLPYRRGSYRVWFVSGDRETDRQIDKHQRYVQGHDLVALVTGQHYLTWVPARSAADISECRWVVRSRDLGER